LREGKENLALAAQSRLNSTNRLIQNYEEMLQRQEAEFQSLKDARLKLEAKLTTVKQEREELQALLDLARSKELTAKTIQSLDDLMGVGDDDISRVAEGIRARLDKATARSEMLAESLDMQMDEVLEQSALEAQLAERKARLGLGED
jgi:phage shock protein A